MFLGLDTKGSLFFTTNFWETNPPLWQGLFVQQAWTLGVELTFYIIAPFIVRKSTLFIFILIAMSLLLRFFIYYDLGLTNDPWTHRFFFSELALFLFGTVAYRLYKRFPIENRSFLWLLFLLALGQLLFYKFFYTQIELLNNWYLYLFFSLTLGYIFQLFKDSRWDSQIGEYSYPIYISHVMIMSFAYFALNRIGLLDYRSELTFVTSVLFSYFLIRFIINPIEKIRVKNVKRSEKAKITFN